jgi:hypothetical protein
MLTRYDGIIERLKARLAGAAKDHYIVKPFIPNDIIEVVEFYVGLPT